MVNAAARKASFWFSCRAECDRLTHTHPVANLFSMNLPPGKPHFSAEPHAEGFVRLGGGIRVHRADGAQSTNQIQSQHKLSDEDADPLRGNAQGCGLSAERTSSPTRLERGRRRVVAYVYIIPPRQRQRACESARSAAGPEPKDVDDLLEVRRRLSIPPASCSWT